MGFSLRNRRLIQSSAESESLLKGRQTKVDMKYIMIDR